MVDRDHKRLPGRDRQHILLPLLEKQRTAQSEAEQEKVQLCLRRAAIPYLGTLDARVSNHILAETAPDCLRDDLLEALDGLVGAAVGA